MTYLPRYQAGSALAPIFGAFMLCCLMAVLFYMGYEYGKCEQPQSQVEVVKSGNP